MKISLGILMVAGANSSTPLTTTLLQRPSGHYTYIYIMTTEEFNSTLNQSEPPAILDPLLLALWYDAKGHWEKSHAIIQDIDTKEAALIHAYLHRKEGDDWNADYWYQRAGSKRSNETLQEELEKLILKFL